jgi:HEPN domain-containing protein
MSGPDQPVRPENRLEARRWLAIVEEDLDVATAAMRLSRLGASAYHVQQAAEKLIKALLVLAGEPFRRTHDLDDLASRLLPVYPQFAGQAEAVRHLSIWGTAYRYPGLEDAPEPLPEIEELEQTIDMLTEFAVMVGSLISEESPASATDAGTSITPDRSSSSSPRHRRQTRRR